MIYADCYNAVAKSIEAAIDSCQTIPLIGCDGRRPRRIAVLGDVEEAGSLSHDMHVEIVQYVAKSNFDILIVAGEKLAQAVEHISNSESLKIMICTNHESVVDAIKSINLNSGDLVLFKSSHSGHLEKVMLRSFPECEEIVKKERESEIKWRKKIAIS